MNTVRVVTQTLVLVVACPASGAYVYRDLLSQGPSSNHTLAARQFAAGDVVSRSSQTRPSWGSNEREAHSAEVPVLVSLDLECWHGDHGTPSFVSHQSVSDTPPPQRGPPVLS